MEFENYWKYTKLIHTIFQFKYSCNDSMRFFDISFFGESETLVL